MSGEHVLGKHTRAIGQGPRPSRGSFHYTIDNEKMLVVVTFTRKLTVRDIERYAKALQSDRSFEPTHSEIVDLTQADELELQAEEFLSLADKIDPFSHESKRAFVVRTSVQNHAARMHRVLRTHRNIEIFSSLEEAERWIAT